MDVFGGIAYRVIISRFDHELPAYYHVQERAFSHPVTPKILISLHHAMQ
jgi:hypothetical protein